MALEASAQPKPGYLLLTFQGTMGSQDVDTFIDRLLEECGKHRPSKVLADFRTVTGTLSTMDRFRMGKTFAERYLAGRQEDQFPPCTYAVLGNQPLIDPTVLGETVAVNRGGPVRAFTDLAQALAWLDSANGS